MAACSRDKADNSRVAVVVDSFAVDLVAAAVRAWVA